MSKETTEKMTDNQLISHIWQTPKLKKLWDKLTADERRELMRGREDMWRIEVEMQDIIDATK